LVEFVGKQAKITELMFFLKLIQVYE
jgi:hypothetical protein